MVNPILTLSKHVGPCWPYEYPLGGAGIVVYTAINNILIHVQASTLTYFSTCPFGQLTTKSICPTQSFSCPKKLIKN
jgi:hypothetical protein